MSTLVTGDAERRRSAAVFAVRFVMTAAIAVGIPVALAGFAAATPAAVAAIFLQLGRPLPARWGGRMFTGILLAALLGGGAALGVLLNGPIAAAAAIVLAFVLALASRGSAIAAVARDPLLIIFIFMGNLPSTGAGPVPALIGGSVAAVIVVVITGLLDRQPGAEAADEVAEAFEGLAEALDRGSGPVSGVDTLRAKVGALALPLGSAGRGQALAGLVANAERQQLLLGRIEREWVGTRPDLGDFAKQDRECAAALAGRAVPPAEEDSAERIQRHLVSSRHEVVDLVRRPGPGEPLDRIDVNLLLLDLDLAVYNAVGLTRKARGRSTPARDRLTRDAPAPAVPRSRVRIALSRVLALISLRSSAMRDALRLAAAAGLAVLAIELLPLQHGYWVVMTAVIALRASSGATIEIGRYQALGSGIGFVLALIPIALAAGAAVSAAIALLALLLFAFAQRAGALLLAPASLTLVFVMALGQLSGAGFVIGTERVLDVAIGIAIAVVAASVVWPSGRERLTARTLAESFETAAALIAVTGAWLVHRSSSAGTSAAWNAALAAGARAEEALTALAAAPLGPEAEYGTAVQLSAVATRIRFHAGAALRNTEHVVPEETGMAELLDAEIDRLTARFRGIASGLAAVEEGSAAAPAPPGKGAGELRAALNRRAEALRDAPIDADEQERFAYAVLVWHWLEEVAREASAAEALLATLRPVESA